MYLSGSLVEKRATPSSDVDIIVVTSFKINARGRADVIAKVEEVCGIPFINPFEFHIMSRSEFESWAKAFKPKLIKL